MLRNVKYFLNIILIFIFGCQTGLPVGTQINPTTTIPVTQTDQQLMEVNLTSKFLESPISRQSFDLQPYQEWEKFVQSNNAFGFSLFQEILARNPDQNTIFSPFSIALALAMTYAGTGGKTAEEMRKVLKINGDNLAYHQAWNYLDQWLEIRTKEIQTNSPDYALRLTNAVWAQQNYLFKDSYLDLLSSEYGSGIYTIDFSSFPEPARLEINQWVDENTNHKISELLSEGDIKPLTRMVLINSIYLNAPWLQPFDINMTSKQPFYIDTQNRVDVDMMMKTTNLPYLVTDEIAMVEIPYDGSDLALMLVMPKQDTFKAFVTDLDETAISDYIAQETQGEVELKFPKFKAESNFELNEMLINMGMIEAFDQTSADFSEMAEGNELYLDKVIHQAFIEVDEAGTEAAAATAAIIMGKSFNPSGPQKITFDHPFVFLLRDIKSGSIMFMGLVVNPNETGK